MYSATQIAQVFKVARETIRKWAVEFEPYLSHDANPGQGRARQFTDADLAVIALVADMKGQGKLYEDIHFSLQAGQRGDVPVSARSLIPSNTPRATELQARVNRLEMELKDAQERHLRLTGEVEALTRQIVSVRCSYCNYRPVCWPGYEMTVVGGKPVYRRKAQKEV